MNVIIKHLVLESDTPCDRPTKAKTLCNILVINFNFLPLSGKSTTRTKHLQQFHFRRNGVGCALPVEACGARGAVRNVEVAKQLKVHGAMFITLGRSTCMVGYCDGRGGALSDATCVASPSG